jgi:hypothetical protein
MPWQSIDLNIFKLLAAAGQEKEQENSTKNLPTIELQEIRSTPPIS